MFRSLRPVVVLVMLAALPFQGLAAITALHCAVAHERPAQHPISDVVATEHAAHSHAGVAVHGHDHVSIVLESVLLGDDEGSSHHPHASDASCCSGALIFDSALTSAPPSIAARDPVVHPPVRYSDHTPGRLERPPLTLLV